MSAEKKNGIYMKVIVGLCGLLIAMVSYVWIRAENRMDSFELNMQESKIERALLLDGDEDIIKALAEFKTSVEKRFDKLEERIGQ